MKTSTAFTPPYAGTKIDESTAIRFLAEDVSDAIIGCWNNRDIRMALRHCDRFRQNILYEMAFQMGVRGLAGFKKTLTFVQTRKFEEAAAEMLRGTNKPRSDWYEDTPERAERLSREMAAGAVV